MPNFDTSDSWKETELKHKALLKSLKENFKNGDWNTVAELTGLSRDTCVSAFKRIHSKNHEKVVTSLREVINGRFEKLNRIN